MVVETLRPPDRIVTVCSDYSDLDPVLVLAGEEKGLDPLETDAVVARQHQL